MNAKALCLIAGVSILVFAGPTLAAGPVQLTASQMDTITAGSSQRATVPPAKMTSGIKDNNPQKSSGEPNSNEGMEIKNLTVADLIGLQARVYTTGDALTLDYRLDRVNIELSKTGKLVSIWIG